MKRFIRWLAIVLIAFLVLCVAGMFAAGYIVDRKTDAMLGKLSSKVAGLQLRNRFTSSTPTARNGRFFWNYEVQGGELLGVDHLSGEVDYTITFGALQADIEFKRVPGSGNFDEICARLGLPPVNYRGKVVASLRSLGVHGEIEGDPLELKVQDGRCEIGPSKVEFSTKTMKKADVLLKVSSVNCRGEAVYATRPSYLVSLEDLQVSARPVIERHKASIDALSVALKSLTAEASTLYLIGFAPGDEVRDPTLRDAFKFLNLKLDLSQSPVDERQRSAVTVRSQGDFHFAVPRLKEGQFQDFYEINHAKLDFNFGRADFKGLLKLLSHDALEHKEQLADCLSDPLDFKLNQLYLESGPSPVDKALELQGIMSASLERETLRPQRLEASFDIKAGRLLVQSLIEGHYQAQLDDLIHRKAVLESEHDYSTKLVFQDGELTLNGVVPGALEEEPAL